jgi:trehalose 6-phosphate synthase/phosphatase
MNHSSTSQQRLVVVSNRLPFTIQENDGNLRFTESAGGLVTGLKTALDALAPSSLQLSGYLWVGWPGTAVAEDRKGEVRRKAGSEFSSHPVFLSEQEMDRFYFGFCNKTIWPLFHYFPSYTVYSEEYWQQYRHVNQMFCDALLEVVKPDDTIWIHDYHLMLLPQMLKEKLPNTRIAFFLHIPFPSFEIFRLLPGGWRREILSGLLGADLIGFHTYEYTQHFLQCVLRILGHEHNMGRIVTADRLVSVETFPMGIDFEKFSSAVNDPEVVREREILRTSLRNVRTVLSVDRLDYTKGIMNRLEGFESLLEANPGYHGAVVLVMVVVPSRIGVEQYDLMKRQIEELVGKINGRFGRVDWTPVIYQYRSVPFQPLVALYSLSDVALVTPLRDGMNLVAKEYIATRLDGTGMLILSEMAGAAKELGEAIIINPNSRLEIAAALKEALEIPPEEQKRRNQIMQNRLRRYTVIRWAQDIVHALNGMQQEQERFCAKLLPLSARQHLVEEFRKSSRRLLLLDYDGTLTPIVRHPMMARPAPELLALIERLAKCPGNAIVIVSGRNRETLDQWFGNLPVSLAAEHGIWIRDRDKEWTMLKKLENGWMPGILPILQLYADRLPGSAVEHKEYSLAWHYRASDPEQGRMLARELRDHLVTFTANIDVQVTPGHKVIEVRPAGATKGSAARHFIEQEQYDFLFSVGDDWTDEDMFGAMPEDAVSIRVGLTNTRAKYNLRAVKDVLRLLEDFAKDSAT